MDSSLLTSALPDHSGELWSEQRPAARRLLTAGVLSFADTGFHGTTTRDITAAADLSPGALYVHFLSKEDLLFAITLSAHQHSLAVLGEPCADDDPSARLSCLVRRFTEWHAHHHVAAKVSQYELPALAPAHLAQINALRRASTEILRHAVTEVAAGRSDPVDLTRITRAICSLSIDLVRWYNSDGPDSSADIGRCYAELALAMVHHRPSDGDQA